MLRKTGDFLIRSTEPKQGEARQYVLSAMQNEELEDAGVRVFGTEPTEHLLFRLSIT